MTSPWGKQFLQTIVTIAGVAGAAAVSWLLHTLGLDGAPVTLVLLVSVILSSWAFGAVQSAVASFLVVLLVSYLYAEPLYSFLVEDGRTYITFALMFSIGIGVSILARQRREALKSLQLRHLRLELLSDLGADIAAAQDEQTLSAIAQARLSRAMGSRVSITGGTVDRGDHHLQAVIPRGAGDALVLTVESRDSILLQGRDAERWLETVALTLGQAFDRAQWRRQDEEKKAALEVAHLENTFLQSVSHDLRTPLTVIGATASSLLEQPGIGERVRKPLEALAVEVESLLSQVDKILDLTQLSFAAEVRREWVPVDDVVISVRERWERWTTLSVQVHPSLTGALLLIDETLVTKALGNLIENAVKYAPGPVDLSLQRSGDLVEFVVSDRGPGVPLDLRSRIFQRFVRGQAEMASPPRGSGIGLALVKAVALAHQGDAGVRPRQGGGSEFWLTVRQTEAEPILWKES